MGIHGRAHAMQCQPRIPAYLENIARDRGSVVDDWHVHQITRVFQPRRKRRPSPIGFSRDRFIQRAIPPWEVIFRGFVQSAGPWRTSGEWWNDGAAGRAWDRDEWDVAIADGTVYRLYVERDIGQWFLEGIVD